MLLLIHVVYVPCLGVVRRLGASKRASQLNTRGLKGSDLGNLSLVIRWWMHEPSHFGSLEAACADGSFFVDGLDR